MTQLDNNNLCIIEYTTTDGEMLSFLEYAFDAEIVAHTYTEVGQIIFDKPISIIGYSAFRECENLASIAIPDSVTDIGEFAFYRCTGLKSITIGENISAIGANAFAECRGEIVINSKEIEMDYPFHSVALDYSWLIGAKFRRVTLGDNITSIGDYAFSRLETIEQVIIPEGVTSIGDYAFCSCRELRDITIPDSVNYIGEGAFANCSSLTTITIPEGVAIIFMNTFANCTELKSVTIADSVDTIGMSAFENCSSLTTITIPAGVADIRDFAFLGCYLLKNIVVADENHTYDSRGGCNAIIETDENCLLMGCSSTTIPASVTDIAPFAFCNDPCLSSIVIPNSVRFLDISIFANCPNLRSVSIGSGVTSIDFESFVDTNIEVMICWSPIPPQSEGFCHTAFAKDMQIYVPGESLEAYKNSSGWAMYSDHIKPIEEYASQILIEQTLRKN